MSVQLLHVPHQYGKGTTEKGTEDGYDVKPELVIELLSKLNPCTSLDEKFTKAIDLFVVAALWVD